MAKINNVNIETQTVEIMATIEEFENVEFDFEIVRLLEKEGYITENGVTDDVTGSGDIYNGYNTSDGEKLYHRYFKFDDLKESNIKMG